MFSIIKNDPSEIALTSADVVKLAANSGVDVGDVDVLSIAAGDNNIGNVDIASALPAGTNAIGKLAANSGVDIGDVDILSIAAGDNNIGNVDIVTLPALVAGTANIGDVDIASLPAGNLGMQVMAASVSVVPASDITDATYIGDIKFGESLPAGTAAIGKLAANSGVDIGDVDILSIAAGDNNIGNVDIVTLPALVAGTANIGDVDVLTIAAGDNNIGNVDIASAIPAGTNNIGDVDILTVAAGANLIGDVGLSGARTSGGTTLYKNIDVDESEDQVKATAGQIYWIHAINLSTAVLYLKIYNATAATVTVGTTAPDLTFPIPTQAATANGAGFVLSIPNGIAFGTAITIACTTGLADNDAGAPGASVCVVNLGYA